MRGAVVVAFALAAGSCGRGCSSCGARESTVGGPAGGAGTPGAAGAAGAGGAGGALTAPLAAAVARGAVVVAALDPGRGTVAVSRLEGDVVAWRADVLEGVAPAPGAAIQAHAVGQDVAVVWRGPRHGRPSVDVALVTPDGGVRGDAFAIGSSSCGTEVGLVWLEAPAKDDARARVRALDGGVASAVRLPADRELELACGGSRAFVIARGDDELAVIGFEPGGAPARTDVLARAADPLEEEREHGVFVVGDELGLVRIGESGAIMWRTVDAHGAAAWKRTSARLAREDELVALDANARAFVLVTTRVDEGEGLRIDAVWVDRATGVAKAHALATGGAKARPRGGEPTAIAVMPVDEALVVLWSEHEVLVARRIDAAGELDPTPWSGPVPGAFAPLDGARGGRVAVLATGGALRVVTLGPPLEAATPASR